MINRLLAYALIGICCFSSMGCGKQGIASDSKVDLFLLESYSQVKHSYRIDEASVKTKNTPLIQYSELISYDPSNYAFALSESAKETLDNIEHKTHGVAFAVKANDKIVYTGYFWPTTSSASCDHTIIGLLPQNDKMYVSLGYPRASDSAPDNRNDPTLIDIFRKDNKLID